VPFGPVSFSFKKKHCLFLFIYYCFKASMPRVDLQATSACIKVGNIKLPDDKHPLSDPQLNQIYGFLCCI